MEEFEAAIFGMGTSGKLLSATGFGTSFARSLAPNRLRSLLAKPARYFRRRSQQCSCGRAVERNVQFFTVPERADNADDLLLVIEQRPGKRFIVSPFVCVVA